MFERLRLLAPKGSFSGPATPKAIAAAEAQLTVVFPANYKAFLLEFGSSDWPDDICGLVDGNEPGRSIVDNTNWERYESFQSMPAYLLPFSPDGQGNNRCFDTSKMSELGECPVVFWDHELSEDQIPTTTHKNFEEWLEYEIDVRLEWDAKNPGEKA
jgi:hypothetical protein